MTALIGSYTVFRYISGALAVALVAVGGHAKLQNIKAAKLTAENASLTRSVASLTMQKEQSALARQVEAARADRMAARATELNATIENILTGDIPDENLDPRLADFINGLQSTD